jgi:hypothetical protein
LIIADNPEKRLIGLPNMTVGIPDHNPDDIRVDKASNLAFVESGGLFEVASPASAPREAEPSDLE